MALYTINTGGDQLSKLSMNLFGMPYQFPDSVDPRINGVSKEIGKNFMENIITEAPILTLIPGKPKYLPSEGNKKAKRNTTSSLLEGSIIGNMDSINQILNDNEGKDMRLYDFERAYTEYYRYVNVLCRTGAAFLGIEDTIQVSSLADTYSFEKFDWMNYRWNTEATQTVAEKIGKTIDALKSVSKPKKKNTKGMTKKQKKAYNKKYKKEMAKYKKANENANAVRGYDDRLTKTDKSDSPGLSFASSNEKEESITDNLGSYKYVQFYVDPESGNSDSMSNSTGESSIKGLFDNGSSTMKDFAFIANSGGIDTSKIADMANGTVSGLQSAVDKLIPDGGAQSIFDRLVNLGSRVVRGENIIIPDIYTSSSYEKSYSITVHLRSPYGTKFGYYMDIFVPMMHLLAFALPKQGTANSYASPFLVKGYVEGLWSINLGIVTDISITKDTESLSVDGLPMAVDVTLNIRDLYSDLSISSGKDPRLFINNSSLVEYLAVSCGLSLTRPNMEARFKMVIDTMISAFTDIPTTVKSSIDETIDNWIQQSIGLKG